MRKIKQLVIILTAALITLPTMTLAAIGPLVPTSCATNGSCGLCDFIQLFINAADIFTGASGVLGVIMFVWAGLILITAYGNESRVQWGKNMMVAAVTGIMVIFLAWTIVNVTILGLYGFSGNQTAYSSVYQTVTGKSLSQWGVCSANVPSDR